MPPIAYRLVPFWFWNDAMEGEEIVQQISEMAEKGVDGFFICARQGLKVAYLSEHFRRRNHLARARGFICTPTTSQDN